VNQAQLFERFGGLCFCGQWLDEAVPLAQLAGWADGEESLTKLELNCVRKHHSALDR